MNRPVNGAPERGEPGGKCPLCGRPPVFAYRPFCSPRCADIDLSRWLKGAYAIPVTVDDDEDGDEPRTGSTHDNSDHD